MSKGKKAGIIVGCIVAVIVILVIATRPSVLPSLGPLGPKVSVDYEVTVDGLHAYLSVTLEGPKDNYHVSLSNPKGETVSDHIDFNEMADGHHTRKLAMQMSSRNPIPGEYCLTVLLISGHKTVFEARPVFAAPHLSIMSVQFESGNNYYPGDIESVTVQVYNSGDLPAFPDRIRLLVAGEELDGPFPVVFPPGEATATGYPSMYGYLEKGTYPVTVEIYSEGAKLASYETYVEIKD